MGKPYALKNRMGLPSDEAAEIAPPHTLFATFLTESVWVRGGKEHLARPCRKQICETGRVQLSDSGFASIGYDSEDDFYQPVYLLACMVSPESLFLRNFSAPSHF